MKKVKLLLLLGFLIMATGLILVLPRAGSSASRAIGRAPVADRQGSSSAAAKRPVSHRVSVSRASAKRSLISSAPACDQGSSPTSSTVSISTDSADRFAFSQACYYAPAEEPLTITFSNSMYYTEDATKSISLTLVISPSSSPAIAADPNEPAAVVGDPSKAVFIGDPVVAPGTGSWTTSGLPAGTYDLQILEVPVFAPSTLVVQ